MSRRFAKTRRPYLRACAAVALGAAAVGMPLSVGGAQLIQIKTIPIADGDQFAFFPSANLGMAGVSLALRDSLLDPFMNPALGARTKGTLFFGAPTSYSISSRAGGGWTMPLGGFASAGQLFGGTVLAVQSVDPNVSAANTPIPVPLASSGSSTTLAPPDQLHPRENDYAFGLVGRRFADAKLSVAASVFWGGLHRIDGVDALYAGSQSVRQHGDAVDVRVGLLKEWSAAHSLSALLLHDRLGMTHDVTFLDTFYDPNTRGTTQIPRLSHNEDRTNTWGLQLAYQRPFRDTTWRMGAVFTGNLLEHPKLPDYQVTQIQSLPWDPGHSAAYNIGFGIARRDGPTTLGLDAIYEPILSHTWAEATEPVQSVSGVPIPTGGKTIENRFVFSNAVVRTGLTEDVKITGIPRPIELQLGVALHSVHYWLQQQDHVTETGRKDAEHWLEWTRSWGLTLHLGEIDLRYLGRVVSGLGRPGVTPEGIVTAPQIDVASNIIAAPSGPLTLGGVTVVTQQISVSIPLR